MVIWSVVLANAEQLRFSEQIIKLDWQQYESWLYR